MHQKVQYILQTESVEKSLIFRISASVVVAKFQKWSTPGNPCGVLESDFQTSAQMSAELQWNADVRKPGPIVKKLDFENLSVKALQYIDRLAATFGALSQQSFVCFQNRHTEKLWLWHTVVVSESVLFWIWVWSFTSKSDSSINSRHRSSCPRVQAYRSFRSALFSPFLPALINRPCRYPLRCKKWLIPVPQ